MDIEEVKERFEICERCTNCHWRSLDDGTDVAQIICTKDNVNILQVKNCDKYENQ